MCFECKYNCFLIEIESECMLVCLSVCETSCVWLVFQIVNVSVFRAFARFSGFQVCLSVC